MPRAVPKAPLPSRDHPHGLTAPQVVLPAPAPLMCVNAIAQKDPRLLPFPMIVVIISSAAGSAAWVPISALPRNSSVTLYKVLNPFQADYLIFSTCKKKKKRGGDMRVPTHLLTLCIKITYVKFTTLTGTGLNIPITFPHHHLHHQHSVDRAQHMGTMLHTRQVLPRSSSSFSHNDPMRLAGQGLGCPFWR